MRGGGSRGQRSRSCSFARPPASAAGAAPVTSTSDEGDREQQRRDRGRLLRPELAGELEDEDRRREGLAGDVARTNTTLPNSPSARANESRDPAAMAGRIAGSTTRRNVVQPLAPSVAAASSSAGSSSSSTGWTVRTTNGRRDEQQRQHDAERREDDVDAEVPQESADRRVRAVERPSVRPVTSVGMASGRSTTVERSVAAREAEPDQHVGDQGPDHRVDGGGDRRGDQREPDRRARARNVQSSSAAIRARRRIPSR